MFLEKVSLEMMKKNDRMKEEANIYSKRYVNKVGQMINERHESRLKLIHHSQQIINEAPLRKKFIEAEKRNKIVIYAGKWDDFRVRRESVRKLYC
jgi:hypothetical protein